MHCKTVRIMFATVLCLGALATPALAQFNVSVNLGFPPPPPVYEAYEEPRPGYVLLPGYWFWEGHQHRWAERRWVEARPGKRWEAPRWEQHGNKHRFKPGRWEKDRGHDNGNNGNGRGNGKPGGGRGNR